MTDSIKLHTDHKKWLRDLDFYEDEIRFFFKELDRIFEKNIFNISTIGNSEEYKNILHKKKNKIVELKEKIQRHELEMSENNDVLKDEFAHEEMELEMRKFVLNFEKLKKTFKRFASRND